MIVRTASEARMGDNDARLIAGCRAGDLDAFGQVYARYEQAVFRHAFYLLGHREDADDVKQETFLRAYRMLGSLRNDYNIRTWLFKICSNLCCDLLRRRQRRPQISLDSESVARSLVDTADLSDPILIAERRHTLAAFLQILHAMPVQQRQVITLYLLEGFDYTQIAEILGCARGAAKMRVLRAMEQYRERVGTLFTERE